MVDLTAIKQAARVTKDENGVPVVPIPLDLWQRVMGEVEIAVPGQPELSQAERIKALLKAWENEPDDQTDEWWEQFDRFLRENRLNFPDRNLGLGDE
jgi:hypothetical protein